MFSPLDPAATAPRPSGFRAALKRSADRALAFVTLEGYDTDDLRERLDPRVEAAAPATSPDLLTALRTPRLWLDEPAGTAAQRHRLRPTDPHRRAAASAARHTPGSTRRPTAAPAPAACTSPVTPASRRTPRA